MLELSNATVAKAYFEDVINEMQGVKIEQIFSSSPSWNSHNGYRRYSDDKPLYIVFENGQCLIIEYYFVDGLHAEFRPMTEKEIADIQDLILTDYFNSKNDIYNCVEGEITDIDHTETIALEYSSLERVELRRVTEEYSKWIKGDIGHALPTSETFDEVKFIMSNGNSFTVCAADAIFDGYVMAWSTDAKETESVNFIKERQMKKYNSIMEILKSKDLSMIEIQEEMERYIADKGMTLEEFCCETEEGQEMMKFNEQRFWKPM